MEDRFLVFGQFCRAIFAYFGVTWFAFGTANTKEGFRVRLFGLFNIGAGKAASHILLIHFRINRTNEWCRYASFIWACNPDTPAL